jgi:hypothetical protein
MDIGTRETMMRSKTAMETPLTIPNFRLFSRNSFNPAGTVTWPSCIVDSDLQQYWGEMNVGGGERCPPLDVLAAWEPYGNW